MKPGREVIEVLNGGDINEARLELDVGCRGVVDRRRKSAACTWEPVMRNRPMSSA
jgi:hypothetical protein